MKRQILYVTLPICAAIIVAGAWLTNAQPSINPPPGPIGVSGRFGTRTAISSLPLTINQSGSYFLSDNLTGVAGQNGISVNVDDVTIDLNGFTLAGVPGSINGIAAGTVIDNLTVINGTIRNWGAQGIAGLVALNSRFEDLHVSDNAAAGISVGTNCIVVHCTSNGNVAGIGADIGCTVVGCTVTDNSSDGIFVATGSIVQGCAADSNGNGIQTSFGCTVVDCIVRNNTFSGITVNSGCTVSGCTAYFNFGDGFSLGSGGTIVDCTANNNTGDGIQASENCRISDCTSANNLAGIHVTGDGNRIEGNNVTDNTRGIDVDNANSIIIRNTARANLTNYEIAANNKVGVIVSAPNSGAISGSTGGAGVGTADPWANFSY